MEVIAKGRWWHLKQRPLPPKADSSPIRHNARSLCYNNPSLIVLMESSVGVTFPNESLEYRAARNRLLQLEAGLRREMEAVAAEIRALPAGGPSARITNSTKLMHRGHRRKCDFPNCSGPAPIR
jgi:hypothetical protein